MSYISSIVAFIRRHKWKLLIAAIILIPLGLIVSYAVSPTQPVYVTEEARKGDLKQAVEAVGTVISDNDLKLQFPQSGIVSGVFIKEGDKVKAGQRLATLRSGNVAADIASAQGRVMAAQATLDALQQGSRPEDIAISEADVQNKQSSLAAAKASLQNAEETLKSSKLNLDALEQEISVSLAGTISNIGSATVQQATKADIALSSMQDIFTKNDVADALIKYGSTDADLLRNAMQSTTQTLRTLQASASPADYDAAISLLDRTRTAIQTASTQVDQVYALISRLPVTTYFTESARSTYKDLISAERTSTQAALSSIDATSKSLRDAAANFTTRMAQERSSLTAAQGAKDRALADIATYQAALQIAQAQLQLKKAPARQTDINSAVASLQQARASLAAASANFQNTVLTSPINGTVTKVNLKVGEITPVGAAVTMLGSSPYRIEMYVSEIDVPKVQLSQSGSVELDAFRGTDFKLRVSEIDTAPTDQSGVNKYRVRLDFVYPHDELKIGMTGDAEIETGIRKDVVSVPLRSVIKSASGQTIVRVLTDAQTVEEKAVATGMEGTDGNVEIVSGIKEGDTVIVLIQ
ncbi:efflux RND transporter periplasmic adaptor subunit [Candidatus Peribacteria bacterium]|nr:MAG: efflux RND transporter periplasmic adaptor subunit [Candidatus Peribacteria bacterium]